MGEQGAEAAAANRRAPRDMVDGPRRCGDADPGPDHPYVEADGPSQAETITATNAAIRPLRVLSEIFTEASFSRRLVTLLGGDSGMCVGGSVDAPHRASPPQATSVRRAAAR